MIVAADIEDAEHAAAARLKYPDAATPASLANGKGAPPMGYLKPAPDLTDDAWARGGTDGEIFDSIQNGVPPAYNMEPWAERLKETETWDLVNYIRALPQT